jgi:hypothetical protein
MAQNETKYLIFDMMLAVQELIWATTHKTNNPDMFNMSKILAKLYISLDFFENLVHNRYDSENIYQKSNLIALKEIEQDWIEVKEIIGKYPDRFIQYTQAIDQVDKIAILKNIMAK